MDDHWFGRYGLPGLFVVIGLGVTYFGILGLRAVFVGARETARAAGHRPRSAGWRAALRIVVWSSFFVFYYFFASLLGRRIGWWALLPSAIGFALMIFGLLQSDALLTARPDDTRRHLRIYATLLGLAALFIAVIWWSA